MHSIEPLTNLLTQLKARFQWGRTVAVDDRRYLDVRCHAVNGKQLIVTSTRRLGNENEVENWNVYVPVTSSTMVDDTLNAIRQYATPDKKAA